MAAIELYSTPLYSDANLIAYYRFNTGALTADSKGSYTLTNSGPATENSSGMFGVAANWADANQSVLKILDALSLSEDSAWSVSWWVKVNSEPSDAIHYLMVKTLITGGHTQYQSIAYQDVAGQKKIYLQLLMTADKTTSANITALGTSVWHHFVYTHSVAGDCILYLDNVSTVTQTGATGTTSWLGNATAFCIGNSDDQYYANAGVSMDDVAIFNDVLTVEEIGNLYNGTWSTAFTKDLTDTFTISDSFSKVSEFFKTLTDTVTISDALTSLKYRLWELVLSDTVVVSDFIGKLWKGAGNAVSAWTESITSGIWTKKNPTTSVWTKKTETSSSWTKKTEPTLTWTKDEPKPNS